MKDDWDICGKCMEEFPRSNLTVYDTVDGNPWPDDILLCPDCAKRYRYEYRAAKQPKTQKTLFQSPFFFQTKPYVYMLIVTIW